MSSQHFEENSGSYAFKSKNNEGNKNFEPRNFDHSHKKDVDNAKEKFSDDNSKRRCNKRTRYFQMEHLDESSERQHNKRSRHFDSKKRQNFEQRERNNKKPEELRIEEVVKYYEKILEHLKQGLSGEDKAVFAQNVLKESENMEVVLSCHSLCSHCLELLLTYCNDSSIIQRFMSAFAQQKQDACMNANASHIMELLICCATQNIKDWSPSLTLKVENEDLLVYSINWINEFGEFILENLEFCLSNIYACHVLCSLIRALGGDIIEEEKFMSKRFKNHKMEFHNMFSDTEHLPTHDPVNMDTVPKSFIHILKRLSKSLVKLEHITDIVSASSSATVIEALLLVLKKRLPRKCKKFIKKLAEKLFSAKNNEGVPLAFLHKECSYVVEMMFKASDEELQISLWQKYFSSCVEQLVVHNIGNYIIQRIFDNVISKSHFEEMCLGMWHIFEAILDSRYYGIFVSVASACNRLKAQQAEFMMNIMHCLQCESQELQVYLIPLLLGLHKYDKSICLKDAAKIPICLHGSLIVQAVFKFQKPIKAVQSMLHMKPDAIAYMANHIQGCHALNSYFSSTSIGEKNKDKLICNLKPVLSAVACNRNGNLTLSRLWVILSIKQKEILIKLLIQNKKELQCDQTGNVILKKFGLFYYEHNYNQWKEIQQNLPITKKKSV